MVIIFLQALIGIAQVDARGFKHRYRRRGTNAMALDTIESAITTEQLVTIFSARSR